MRALIGIAGSGLQAVLLSPLRSLVTTACLVAVLTPYLVGLGISRGIQHEAEESIRLGADLTATGTQFGRDVPLPLSAAAEVKKIEGVREVIPRIVGTMTLGKEGVSAVVVGIPPEHFPPGISCVEGRLPTSSTRNELVVGTDLAQRLHLHLGDRLPPFYRNRRGEKLSEIVGLFQSDVSLWQSRLILTTFDTAAAFFDQPGVATDLLVTCRPGYQGEIQQAIGHIALPTPLDSPTLRLRATTREDLSALIPRDLLHREGIFNLLFVVAFAVAILVVAVTSGFGLADRRREVGILKATGWQTDQLLVRASVESLSIVVGGFSISLILAFVWLEWFNGFWVAGIFLPGVGIRPSFRVPFELAPIPALLGLVISFVIVMAGTVYSTWRAAMAPPFEVIRS